MKLLNLHLHPFAGTIDKQYNFEDGLNVVYGHNEAGKSTIVNAFLAVLLESTDLTKTVFKNTLAKYMPIGGDTINIDLKFEVAGIKYQLKKSWGANNFSSLNKVGEVPINNADTVQKELFKLLNLNKSTVREMIFTTQAKISNTIDAIKKDPDINNSLDQILRGAILNTGGIIPEKLKVQLEKEFNELSLNWNLENDAPEISTNNKGSYDNRWEKGLGEILKLAYEINDKQKAKLYREQYDEKLSNIANEINILRGHVNLDQNYIDSNRNLMESLSNRITIQSELKSIESNKNEIVGAQSEWYKINAMLPVLNGQIIADKEQLNQLNTELENARKSGDITIKIAQFDKVSALKIKYDTTKELLTNTKVVTNVDVENVKKLEDELIKAQNELNALASAQNFIVEIQPKKNLTIELQHGIALASQINLVQGEPYTIEVNKSFVYSSDEVTIEVKSLTQEISILNDKITLLKKQFEDAVAIFGVINMEELKQNNLIFNQNNDQYKLAKTTFENSIAGTTFEKLKQDIEELKNIPKTREKEVLEKLYQNLIGKMATDDNSYKLFEVKIKEFEKTYTSLENLVELIIGIRQNEKITQDKLNLLPAIDPSNDMETFQKEYRATSERFDINKSLLQEKELERAKHEGQEQFDLALEIQDQIELLDRKKNQKVQEAKAIQLVLNKLNDVLNRATINPYQAYETNLSNYLSVLSGGKYQSLSNSGVSPNAIKNTTNNLELPIEMLSQGTSGILGLSLRLAIADYFLGENNGFIAFDDPMVDFDENRQLFAATCLQNYSQNKQVIIFTCHQSHAAHLGGYLINLN
jgi:exonuclease SbcC